MTFPLFSHLYLFKVKVEKPLRLMSIAKWKKGFVDQ